MGSKKQRSSTSGPELNVAEPKPAAVGPPKPKPAAKFVVAPGKSICGTTGHLDAGAPVTAGHLNADPNAGAVALKSHVADGTIVEA